MSVGVSSVHGPSHLAVWDPCGLPTSHPVLSCPTLLPQARVARGAFPHLLIHAVLPPRDPALAPSRPQLCRPHVLLCVCCGLTLGLLTGLNAAGASHPTVGERMSLCSDLMPNSLPSVEGHLHVARLSLCDDLGCHGLLLLADQVPPLPTGAQLPSGTGKQGSDDGSLKLQPPKWQWGRVTQSQTPRAPSPRSGVSLTPSDHTRRVLSSIFGKLCPGATVRLPPEGDMLLGPRTVQEREGT